MVRITEQGNVIPDTRAVEQPAPSGRANGLANPPGQLREALTRNFPYVLFDVPPDSDGDITVRKIGAHAIAHLRSVSWTFLSVAAVNLALFGVCIALTHRYRFVKMPMIGRKWFDIPVRAFLVACLVAAVVGLSGHVGPTMTGLLAVYPIVMTSLMLIFQPRVGGPAAAALIANTMWGLVGFSACLFTVHLAVMPLGTWGGLTLSLVVAVVWNLVLYGIRRRALLRRATQS